MKHAHSNKSERGIALLTVIMALVSLMIIAVPFALQMRKGFERSRDTRAREKARMHVDSILGFNKAFLAQTTEWIELANRAADGTGVNSDPEADTVAEITPTLEQFALLVGEDVEKLRDPYGTILDWTVEDENGKFNINNCSPFALGNLLGLSVLAKELNESDSTIEVEDASAFPPMGYVKVGRELIKYTAKDGNRLTGCERDVAAGTNLHGKAEKQAAGMWVVNYAAWAIAYYHCGRHPGEWTRFDNLDVSDISLMTPGLDADVPVITRSFFEMVAPFLTYVSKGELAEGWNDPQPVAEGTSLPGRDPIADTFTYVNSAHHNCGTLIRIREKAETNVDRSDTFGDSGLRPQRKDYAMVFNARTSGRSTSLMELFGRVNRTFSGNQMVMETYTRHPVNVNTAPREVLIALFANLQLRSSTQDRVTPADAAKVADEIIRLRDGPKPLRSMQGFRTMLVDLADKTQAISRNDRNAIFRNCLDSNDQELRFGTAPICFKTFDVYTIRASATVSDSGGRLMAKHRATEVVEIGSQVSTMHRWVTQRDFEEQVIAGNNQRYWTTFPKNTGQVLKGRPVIEPSLRWPKQLNSNLFPWDPYDATDPKDKAFETTTEDSTSTSGNGTIRLLPMRAEFDTAKQDPTFVQHFDNSDFADGFNAEQGYTVDLSGDILKAIDNDLVRPFAVQFWWQPQEGPQGDTIIFDVGESEWLNRYVCYIDKEPNEMVFAVSDNTDSARAAELRFSLEEMGGFKTEIWYHIHLVASGCHPSMMQMIIDGRAVGKSNVLTFLTGSVSEEDGSFTVENTAGWPPQGAAMCGTEVFEYEEIGDGQLIVRKNKTTEEANGRGARGTDPQQHIEGTPVVLLGWSKVLLESILTGGAVLEGQLGPFSIVQFDTSGPPDSGAYPGAATREDYSWLVAAAGAGGGGGGTGGTTYNAFTFKTDAPITGLSVIPWGLDSAADELSWGDAMRAFQPSGYCWVIGIMGTANDWDDFLSNRENIRARVLFMRYTWADPTNQTGLILETPADNDGSQIAPEAEAEFEILAGYYRTGAGVTPVLTPSRIVIIPISVRSTETTTDNYVNPADDGNKRSWYCQIMGQNQNDDTIWEWFAYDEHFQYSGHSYFCKNRLPNDRPLIDRIAVPDWDETQLDRMSDDISGGTGGTDPGGTDPGGTDPDPGGGGGGGGTDPDPGGGGGDPPQQPPDPEADPPGGEGGSDPTDPGTEDDGPGGEGGGGGDPTEPGSEGDGPGGDTPGPGGDDVPPPVPDPGGGEGGGIPPSEGGPPSPGGGGSDDGGSGGGGGGGGGVDSGGSSAGLGGGDGDPRPDPSPGTNQDITTYNDNEYGAVEIVAHWMGFRGLQADWDGDGLRDDSWNGEADPFHPNGTTLYPVSACYGGIEPGGFTPGEDYAVTPRPGIFDAVNIVTGDDETRIGGNASCFWSMNGNDDRLLDDTDNDGIGDTETFDFDYYVHLFALTQTLPTRIDWSEDVNPRVTRDNRKFSRLLCFPSSEMIDNRQGLTSEPRIGVRFSGETYHCVVDEILGDSQSSKLPLFLKDEFVAEDGKTLTFVNREGAPADDALPEDGPGVLKIGNEIVVFRTAEVVDGGIQFTGCVRGAFRSEPSAYERGTQAEILFGIYVAILTESSSDSSNLVAGEGFGRFPRTGCVRLENTESRQVELRVYTTNTGSSLQMPVGDSGGGMFVGRYGTVGLTFESGSLCAWHPIRNWDRFSDFNDHPEMCHWTFSTEFRDAFIKRIWWEEGQAVDKVTVRAVCRLNESVPWNAKASRVIPLSQSGEGDAGGGGVTRRAARGDPLKYLYSMEVPDADNLILLQADKVEVRMLVIFEQGAFRWDDMSASGWKRTPKIEELAIEFVQQNRVRRHIDR